MQAKFPAGNIPGEIVNAVLGHLNDDGTSLRACTLVAHSWWLFARCHLLQAVVCRPDAPHLSLRHLSTFLSSTPDIVPYVRSLKIIGSKPASEIEVAVEDVVRLLSTLPSLKSLSFERVPLFTPACPHDPPIEEALLPSSEILTLSLCAIRYTDSTDSFFRVLRDHLGPKSIRAVLRFAGRDDHSSFPAFLNSFGPNITHLSCNSLGSIGDFGLLVGGLAEADNLVYDARFNPRVDIPPCTSVDELVLYITGSGFAHPDLQMVLLWGQLHANVELSKFLTPDVPIRHVNLRFQRFGPHTKDTEQMFEDILNPGNWFQWTGWLEEFLLRFKDLEMVTCILCDGGLVEQYGDYLPADPTSTASGSVERTIGHEEEYDFYESYMRRMFPQFLAKGLLQIRSA